MDKRCLSSMWGISPNADFSHSRNIIPVILSGLISHLGFSGLHILNTAPPFLLLSLSFSGEILRLGSCCAATCWEAENRSLWTVIFHCSVLLRLWAGGVWPTTAQAQMCWTGTALKSFKGHRSCRREKLEIWNTATWLPAEHKWTLDSIITPEHSKIIAILKNQAACFNLNGEN